MMAEPDVESGDDSGETDSPDEPDSPGDSDDVEVVQTDVATTGEDPQGFFDGVEEEVSDSTTAGGIFDGVEDGDEDDDGESSGRPDGTRSGGMARDINNGAARAAVIGLDDEWETSDGTKTKDDLQTEFKETFEAFRLGHYGERVAEEYFMMDAEDIHPVWGLVGASLICAAVIALRRPDGDELVDATKMRLGDMSLDSFRDVIGSDESSEEDKS